MFQGTNGPENESSIMGTNVPGNEWSWERIFQHSVLLHRLNNTLTYCSAQLTRTLTPQSPVYIAPQNECSWELSLRRTNVPGNFYNRERKFPGTFVPVGTFAPRSENTGERKVPEPFYCTTFIYTSKVQLRNEFTRICSRYFV